MGGKTGENHPSYPLPLNKADRTREVLSTYFNDTDLYDVHDSSGNAVRSATGRELIDYLDDLRRGEDERWRKMKKTKDEKEEKEHWDQEEFARRIKALEEEKKQKTYTYRFRNSRTKRLYSTDLWDENGRKRSTLELAFMLACVVLKSEGSLWEPKGKIPEDRKNDPIFGRVNWKLQNMMDSIHLASEEGIDTQSELNLRVNEAGAEYSRARSNLQKTQRAEIRMSTLAKALDDYDCTKELAERIQALLEGPEKERLQQQYEIEIGRYRTAKAVMYGYKVTTQNQIDDFRIRYADIKSNIPAMQERLNKTKEQYRKLKKLQYNVALAQMEHYCYGPNYCADANFSCEELVKQDKTIKKAEYER